VFWLERHSALFGLAGLVGAFAVAIAIGEHSTAAAYGRYVADGCVQHRDTYACVTGASLATPISFHRFGSPAMPSRW
jgi:hypothetical protein